MTGFSSFFNPSPGGVFMSQSINLGGSTAYGNYGSFPQYSAYNTVRYPSAAQIVNYNYYTPTTYGYPQTFGGYGHQHRHGGCGTGYGGGGINSTLYALNYQLAQNSQTTNFLFQQYLNSSFAQPQFVPMAAPQRQLPPPLPPEEPSFFEKILGTLAQNPDLLKKVQEKITGNTDSVDDRPGERNKPNRAEQQLKKLARFMEWFADSGFEDTLKNDRIANNTAIADEDGLKLAVKVYNVTADDEDALKDPDTAVRLLKSLKGADELTADDAKKALQISELIDELLDDNVLVLLKAAAEKSSETYTSLDLRALVKAKNKDENFTKKHGEIDLDIDSPESANKLILSIHEALGHTPSETITGADIKAFLKLMDIE